jgi:aspartyl/asparaginyl beta-hydroxylase (cupin superfamily)
MNKQSTKPWFSEGGTEFTIDDPYFFDTNDFPWVKELESHWEVIRDELIELHQNNKDLLKPYADAEMTSRKNKWKTFGMMFWKFQAPKNIEACPKTWALVSKVPNLMAASFNLLEENTTIKPHHGDTNAIIRCHMGLQVPGEAPKCAFRVGTETRSWEQGKFFMFCDAHEHTAWNNTNNERYVLVVDIMRPEFARMQKNIACRVLSSINLAVSFQNNPWFKKLMGKSLGKQFMLMIYRSFFRLMFLLGMDGKVTQTKSMKG